MTSVSGVIPTMRSANVVRNGRSPGKRPTSTRYSVGVVSRSTIPGRNPSISASPTVHATDAR